jgi:uncharacterized protein
MTPSLPTHTTDLIHTLQVHLPELQQAYGVRTLGVFGSHVRGEARLDSDLDVLVEFDEQRPLSLFQFVELENRLGDLLGLRVDLVEKATLKPVIGRHILAEVVPV